MRAAQVCPAEVVSRIYRPRKRWLLLLLFLLLLGLWDEYARATTPWEGALFTALNTIRAQHGLDAFGIDPVHSHYGVAALWYQGAPCPSDITCGGSRGWWTTIIDGEVLGPDAYCARFGVRGPCQVAMLRVRAPAAEDHPLDWAVSVIQQMRGMGPCYEARLMDGICDKGFIIDGTDFGRVAIWIYDADSAAWTVMIRLTPGVNVEYPRYSVRVRGDDER